jgi:hypothetical protein
MTAENKAKQLINDCWSYADKTSSFIGRANAKELARLCVKEILEEVHNFCSPEAMEESKKYFNDVLKQIDKQ